MPIFVTISAYPESPLTECLKDIPHSHEELSVNRLRMKILESVAHRPIIGSYSKYVSSIHLLEEWMTTEWVNVRGLRLV